MSKKTTYVVVTIENGNFEDSTIVGPDAGNVELIVVDYDNIETDPYAAQEAEGVLSAIPNPTSTLKDVIERVQNALDEDEDEEEEEEDFSDEEEFEDELDDEDADEDEFKGNLNNKEEFDSESTEDASARTEALLENDGDQVTR